MLKELSWYIETNRFTNIVEEIEEKAAAYSEALKTDSENKEELRDDLRTLCQWHMEKSGYKTESVPYLIAEVSSLFTEALIEEDIVSCRCREHHSHAYSIGSVFIYQYQWIW